jgi:4-hydroxy-L-threonine phosphate dehydrogenase PdxA
LNNKFTKKLTKLYLDKSFGLAIKLIKKNLSDKLINGPINKKTFLNKKTPGITEYISNKCQIKKTGMLIYNKKLSVCP